MVEFSKKYGMAEQLRMQKGLARQYQNSYYLHAYDKYRATGQLDIKLNHFNEQQLENIVYRPWKGSDFSKRIWKEYTEILPDEVTDALLRGTLFGYSPNKVVKMMRDRFQKVSERDLHRLVITEMVHAAEEATAQFYKDSDIEQYQYLATLESHTCDQCAHLDERIFNVKDKKEGINYPLIHPYCRCTTVPYDKDLPDVETRWSRDPETGKRTYVKDMSYSEWKIEQHVQLEKLSMLPSGKYALFGLNKNRNNKKDYGFASRGELEKFKAEIENYTGIPAKNIKWINEVTGKDLNIIERTLKQEFKAHPELKNYVTGIVGATYENDLSYIAEAHPEPQLIKPAHGYLILNQPALKNSNEVIKRNVSKGFRTKKTGYDGIIKHEMGHFVEQRADYELAGIDPSVKSKTFKNGWHNIESRKFAVDIVSKTISKFLEIDIRSLPETEQRRIISKHISKYSVFPSSLADVYGEAFAKLYSNANTERKIKKVFDNFLSLELKKLYKN